LAGYKTSALLNYSFGASVTCSSVLSFYNPESYLSREGEGEVSTCNACQFRFCKFDATPLTLKREFGTPNLLPFASLVFKGTARLLKLFS